MPVPRNLASHRWSNLGSLPAAQNSIAHSTERVDQYGDESLKLVRHSPGLRPLAVSAMTAQRPANIR